MLARRLTSMPSGTSNFLGERQEPLARKRKRNPVGCNRYEPICSLKSNAGTRTSRPWRGADPVRLREVVKYAYNPGREKAVDPVPCRRWSLLPLSADSVQAARGFIEYWSVRIITRWLYCCCGQAGSDLNRNDTRGRGITLGRSLGEICRAVTLHRRLRQGQGSNHVKPEKETSGQSAGRR